MILKSPPINISMHPHNTPYKHTLTHLHTSDNHIAMYKTLLRALCLHAHTHYTHVISLDLRHLRRYIFTLKTAITYAGQENNRHSPFDVVLMSLQEKPLVEGYYTHTFCTPTHTELSPSLYRQDIRKDIIQRRKWHYFTCTHTYYVCTVPASACN